MLMPFDVSQKDSIEEHHDIHNMPPDGQTTRWRHTPPNGGFGWNIHWGSPTLGGVSGLTVAATLLNLTGNMYFYLGNRKGVSVHPQ